MTVLLVLATFIIFILAGMALQRARAPKGVRVPAAAEVKAGINPSDVRIPKDVYFHPGHTWAMLQSPDFAWVGIDDFIQKLVDPISEIVPPEVGAEVKQGDSLVRIKLDSQELSIKAPISGRILGVNEDLIANLPPQKTDAITKQWVVNLKPTNLEEDLVRLSITAKAKEWLGGEIERLRDFFERQALRPQLAGQTLQDGGEPVHGALHSLDTDGLKQFEKEFLVGRQ